MRGGGLRKEGYYFYRVLLDWLGESLSSVVRKDQYRGHRFAGGFGHGARISIWYPRARKLS
jgi:hypothetical protein